MLRQKGEGAMHPPLGAQVRAVAQPYTRNPKPQTLPPHPKLQTPQPTPQTPDITSHIPHPTPHTPHPTAGGDAPAAGDGVGVEAADAPPPAGEGGQADAVVPP